jgi:hypothetical protein
MNAVDIYGQPLRTSLFYDWLAAKRHLGQAECNIQTAIAEVLTDPPDEAVRTAQIVTALHGITDIDDQIVVRLAVILCRRHEGGPRQALGWNCEPCMGEAERLRQCLIAEPEQVKR